ncbi:MAG: Gfo/Idh/MocA family protein [Armatimonadota bacterium]
MGKVRFGYVGCGFMAQKVHLPNFAAIPDCELVALAELRPELGEKVRQRFGIPHLYRHHLELAQDDGVEAAGVSAAFGAQSEIARDLLAAGKQVFMEKPMAVSVEQAEAMLAAAEEGGGRLMVAYMKRYDAGNEMAKEAVDEFRQSGELGQVTYARNHGFCGDWVAGLDAPMDTTDEPMPPSPTPLPSWLPPEWGNSYLGYLQQWTHNINLLRWFLDAGDDVRVKAVDLDDDGMTGIVVFDMAGVRAVVESAGLSHYRWDEHTQVYFQHGWVHTWAPPLLLRNQPAEVEIYRAGDRQEFTRKIPRPAWTWSFRREAEHFIERVRSGEQFRSSGQDTLTDVRLYEEIYKAFLEGRK